MAHPYTPATIATVPETAASPIEPPEIQPPTLGNPTEPPPEEAPGNPRPEDHRQYVNRANRRRQTTCRGERQTNFLYAGQTIRLRPIQQSARSRPVGQTEINLVM